jgi:aspartate racemase
MRTLGLIGGLSWESTALYYRHLNELVRARLGGLASAQLLLWSFNFADVARLQHDDDWDGAAALMVDAARRLHRGGAEALVVCSNTMHRMAEALERAVPLPLLHIADATGEAIRAAGLRRPALLATRFTMEQDFYKQRLRDRHGLDVLVPDEAGRTMVHDVIYDELCQGAIRDESRTRYQEVVSRLSAQGADALILGCTEVALLIGPEHVDLPVFDTTRLHAEAAVAFALGA